MLGGRHPTDRKRAAGIYGKYVSGGGYTGEIRSHEAGGPSRNVTLRDFAIIGDIRERVDEDQVNALGGAMTNSVVDNLWLENTKVGAWMDGPMDNFTIRNSRILDQTADGVNFHTGVTNSTVTNTFVRNTGDDASGHVGAERAERQQLLHPQHHRRDRSWRTTWSATAAGTSRSPTT